MKRSTLVTRKTTPSSRHFCSTASFASADMTGYHVMSIIVRVSRHACQNAAPCFRSNRPFVTKESRVFGHIRRVIRKNTSQSPFSNGSPPSRCTCRTAANFSRSTEKSRSTSLTSAKHGFEKGEKCKHPRQFRLHVSERWTSTTSKTGRQGKPRFFVQTATQRGSTSSSRQSHPKINLFSSSNRPPHLCRRIVVRTRRKYFSLKHAKRSPARPSRKPRFRK